MRDTILKMPALKAGPAVEQSISSLESHWETLTVRVKIITGSHVLGVFSMGVVLPHVGPVQRESNMHRIEVHHFASPFAPNFPAGENSGFIQEIL